MEPFRIEEIARRLFESVPPAFRTAQKDLETNFRAVLRSTLGKLDLVTRDEFDAQTRVLQRTREKLERLEGRLREMETAAGRLNETGASAAAGSSQDERGGQAGTEAGSAPGSSR